jgi:hypothetical protein
MAQTTGQNLPLPQSPFVNPDQTLSNDGYQFLLGLLSQAESQIPTATVNQSLEATGTNQATALQLTAQWNEVVTVPSGSGVLLASFHPGQTQVVFNASSANALKVFPPPGFSINALAENAAFSLAAGARATFEFFSDTQIVT